MLFEQAFYALPEILHGSGYQRQDYEAGVVGAFTLAVLQVLNGRNINNPIGCIQAEKLFRQEGRFDYADDRRYLRADLYLDVSRLYVGSRRLAQYGWRHELWLEGKFMRNQAGDGSSHSSNKTNHVAGFIADLVRLAALVPEQADNLSRTGRYFLHVYDAEPRFYLTTSNRSWCKKLFEAGAHEIKLDKLGEEKASVKALLGDLGTLKVELNVTNSVAFPLTTTNQPVYWCCLTRIDQATLTLGNYSFHIAKNRKVTESSTGSIQAIAAHVATNLHIKPESAEASAPPEEPEDDNDEEAILDDGPPDTPLVGPSDDESP